MRIVYLHGFASGPGSSKAQFFRARFEELGVPFEIPRLDEGNFQALTISGQLRVIDRAVQQGGDRTTLMGSSLGGYLAALYAARHEGIEKLVLLAPAFQFPSRWRTRFERDLAQWRSDGQKNFYHYALGGDRPLGYQFVEDAVQYEEEPDFRQSGLIFHGTRDDVVPAEVSEQFASRHPDVRLRLLDSGHELTDVLDIMWVEVAAFLGLPDPGGFPNPRGFPNPGAAG
jgi:pimeloyl-ACP methyl ester carboxylesterase